MEDLNGDDVIVVGAGPTGLMIACELALAGVRCRVLEQRGDDQSNIARAFALHARALELLDARGMGDVLVQRGNPLRVVRPAYASRVNFGALSTRFPMLLMIPQNGTEHLLRARAEELGVQVLRGLRVVGLNQDEQRVELTLADGRHVAAPFVIGADGAHSTVRELVGAEFEGEQYTMPMVLADVRLDDSAGPPPLNSAGPDGVVVALSFGDGWYRVGAWLLDSADQADVEGPRAVDPDPPTLDLIRDAFRRIAGRDYGMHEMRWISRFVSERRQATSYRFGRVFLVGDAAHVNSPMGGQGMNTGLQDAFNLGWKLAAHVRGWAPSWLLDSYHAERHPVGTEVLGATDRLTRMVLEPSSLRRWFTRHAMSVALATPAGRRRILGTISGLDLHYSSSVGAGSDGGEVHRMVGRRVPDVPTTAGRLYEVLRDGRFVLVTDDPGSVPSGWQDRVDVVGRSGPGGPTTILIRPDGYAAWANDHTADPAAVRSALLAWCGRPAARGPGTHGLTSSSSEGK